MNKKNKIKELEKRVKALEKDTYFFIDWRKTGIIFFIITVGWIVVLVTWLSESITLLEYMFKDFYYALMKYNYTNYDIIKPKLKTK